MHVSGVPEYRWTLHETTPTWSSAAIAVAATLLLFAAAFAAMTHIRERQLAPGVAEQPSVVRLLPPIVKPRVEAPAQPARRLVPPAVRPTPIAAPATPVPPANAQPVTVVPVVPTPPQAARDSATSKAAAQADAARSLTELRPRQLPPLEHVPPMLGTPPSPAGVTIHNRKLTPEQLDAMTNSAMAGMAAYARTHPPTPEEKEAALRGPHPPPLQNGPAGDMRAKVLSTAGASIDVPFLSPGPSPAQRKRNAAIDADYQLRLRRLQDRSLLVRDSIRADSVRRDSLAHAAQAARAARRPKAP